MTWIKAVPYLAAIGKLKVVYDRVKGPNYNVDNIMMMHSLRPHSMKGHIAIYKYVLHYSGNTIPKWFLESLRLWVSSFNECSYWFKHHFPGVKTLLADAPRAHAIRVAIEVQNPVLAPLNAAQKITTDYAQVFIRDQLGLTENHIIGLRNAGYTDGVVHEINQVRPYFSYANQTVLGLGCSTRGGILGLSPKN